MIFVLHFADENLSTCPSKGQGYHHKGYEWFNQKAVRLIMCECCMELFFFHEPHPQSLAICCEKNSKTYQNDADCLLFWNCDFKICIIDRRAWWRVVLRNKWCKWQELTSRIETLQTQTHKLTVVCVAVKYRIILEEQATHFWKVHLLKDPSNRDPLH